MGGCVGVVGGGRGRGYTRLTAQALPCCPLLPLSCPLIGAGGGVGRSASSALKRNKRKERIPSSVSFL